MSSFTSSSDAHAKGGHIDPLTRQGQCMFYKAQGPTVEYLEEEDFHIATPDAKAIMFRDHRPTQAAQEAKAQELHKRLLTVAPAIAEHFEVKKSALESMTFRLWEQRETHASREDSYVALSYCWDSDKYPPRKGIKYPLPIS